MKLNDKKSLNYSNIDLNEFKIILNQKNELFNLYSNSHLSKLRNAKFIQYYKWFLKKIILLAGDPNSINSKLFIRVGKT